VLQLKLREVLGVLKGSAEGSAWQQWGNGLAAMGKELAASRDVYWVQVGIGWKGADLP
jgi:hypothetical protein